MFHRINVLRLGCLAPRGLAAAIAATAVILAAALGSAPAGAATCPGRFLLSCSEKQALFPDAVTWQRGYVLDFEIFETKTSLPLWNRALNGFWRFEAATAAARGELEYGLASEVYDSDFEQLPSVPNLPLPSVRPWGVVNRKLARHMSWLMQAEQRYVLWLDAMDTAMNRATFARYNQTRKDWVAWQESSAAGYAIRAAAALGQVIKQQPVVARELIAKRLLFGVGVTDLKLSQRRVRRHGFARFLVRAMRRLGLTGPAIAHIQSHFVSIKPQGGFSFSLTGLLDSAPLLSKERAFQSTLREFAARIPPAGRPPS
jgi:hypothetical protein